VFNFKANLTDKISNELSVGTELQQSKSQISNYRFVGTDPANPLKVQELSKGGSYFKYNTNQYAVFFHNRTDFNALNLSLILGLSANQINYSRMDLLANQGLVSGYNKDLSFEKSFSTSFNPHIALQKVFKEQIINLSYSEGYNAPTASTSFIGTINKSNDNLLPEKAKMFDLSVKGVFFNNKFDYQVSVFNINISNKLTQLSGVNPAGGTYNYFANTGNQTNKGMELSLGYLMLNSPKSFIKKIEPFLNYSNYDFKYNDFKTKFGSEILDYSNKQVVGLPKTKYTVGVDIITKLGMYFNGTYNVIGDVYTDFANTNNVKGFALLNSKIGYKITGKKMDFDVYFAGNNLTNQINYTFLFLGNNINDSDPDNNYPVGVATDVNPGPNKAYYFGGVNVKFMF
jgi:iron complex outermembrane receptor protein